MGNTNRNDRNERNRRMAEGVQKHLTAPIGIDGVMHSPAETAQILTDPAAKAATTLAAEGTFHQAVLAEQSSVKAADAAFLAVKAVVLNQFKGQPTVLADFGIAVKARKVPTAEQKAAAALKRKARADAKKAALAAAKNAPATPAPNAAPAAPAAGPVTTPKS